MRYTKYSRSLLAPPLSEAPTFPPVVGVFLCRDSWKIVACSLMRLWKKFVGIVSPPLRNKKRPGTVIPATVEHTSGLEHQFHRSGHLFPRSGRLSVRSWHLFPRSWHAADYLLPVSPTRHHLGHRPACYLPSANAQSTQLTVATTHRIIATVHRKYCKNTWQTGSKYANVLRAWARFHPY